MVKASKFAFSACQVSYVERASSLLQTESIMYNLVKLSQTLKKAFSQ